MVQLQYKAVAKQDPSHKQPKAELEIKNASQKFVGFCRLVFFLIYRCELMKKQLSQRNSVSARRDSGSFKGGFSNTSGSSSGSFFSKLSDLALNAVSTAG
jgi:hypothetical protein